MVVSAYYPAKGQIEIAIVKNIRNEYQLTFRSRQWYIGKRWESEVILDLHVKKGFLLLPEPVDFEFFVKNINQFEG
jgi:hypothetical protein